MTTKINDDICPNCKSVLNACTGVNSEQNPSPGDITICFYCGSVLKFSDDMTLVEPTIDDYVAMPKDGLFEIIMIQQQIIKKNGK